MFAAERYDFNQSEAPSDQSKSDSGRLCDVVNYLAPNSTIRQKLQNKKTATNWLLIIQTTLSFAAASPLAFKKL